MQPKVILYTLILFYKKPVIRNLVKILPIIKNRLSTFQKRLVIFLKPKKISYLTIKMAWHNFQFHTNFHLFLDFGPTFIRIYEKICCEFFYLPILTFLFSKPFLIAKKRLSTTYPKFIIKNKKKLYKNARSRLDTFLMCFL